MIGHRSEATLFPKGEHVDHARSRRSWRPHSVPPTISSSSFADAFTVGGATRSVSGPRHAPFLHDGQEGQQAMVVQLFSIGMTYITNSNYLLVYV